VGVLRGKQHVLGKFIICHVMSPHHGGAFKARKTREAKFHTFLGCRVPSSSFGQKDGFKNIITIENREKSCYFF